MLPGGIKNTIYLSKRKGLFRFASGGWKKTNIFPKWWFNGDLHWQKQKTPSINKRLGNTWVSGESHVLNDQGNSQW